jgi:ABC-type lipoprotein export system ATPase subunit
MKPLLEVRSGRKILTDGTTLFRDVGFQLYQGRSLALIGRSGSGKSTLLAVLGLMESFDSGQLIFRGKDLTSASSVTKDRMRSRHVGFIFQRFALIAHLSVLENVILPLRHDSNMSYRANRAKALGALESVEMGRHASKYPRQLSGGEQQRIAIARAMVKDPDLILADEPTGSLDWEIGTKMIDLLTESFKERGASLIVVTHDWDIANRMDDVLKLEGGNLSSANLSNDPRTLDRVVIVRDQ